MEIKVVSGNLARTQNSIMVLNYFVTVKMKQLRLSGMQKMDLIPPLFQSEEWEKQV